MLSKMLTQANNAYKKNRTHNSTLLLNLTEMMIVELKRYNYALPCNDPLPDNYGGHNGPYRDTIKLWYEGGVLFYEFYYPSRGTGDATHKGKFIDADPSIQNRTFRLLYDAWRKLSCEMEHRMGDAVQAVRRGVQADKEGRRRDAETRKAEQKRYARPVPPPEPAKASTDG